MKGELEGASDDVQEHDVTQPGVANDINTFCGRGNAARNYSEPARDLQRPSVR